MSKPRIVKDYEKLPEEVVGRLKSEYPYGFAQNLIKYTNAQGKRISALPFETDEVYYLIKMNEDEAVKIIEEDDDYDDSGKLRDDYDAEEEFDSGTSKEVEIADDTEETDPYKDDDDDDDLDDESDDEDDDDDR
jgi:hypothetical protein